MPRRQASPTRTLTYRGAWSARRTQFRVVQCSPSIELIAHEQRSLLRRPSEGRCQKECRMHPRYTALLALLLAWSWGPAEAIELSLPIDCQIGVTCEVQNYVDLDPSSQVRDYQCGNRTYN